jgi:hypothetical protein
MKPRSFLAMGLLTVLFLAACAPAASPTPAQPDAMILATPQQVQPAASLPTAAADEIQPQPTQTAAPATELPTAAPQGIATSRGPDLEASDPATVNLASGGLQLVEFFRFT